MQHGDSGYWYWYIWNTVNCKSGSRLTISTTCTNLNMVKEVDRTVISLLIMLAAGSNEAFPCDKMYFWTPLLQERLVALSIVENYIAQDIHLEELVSTFAKSKVRSIHFEYNLIALNAKFENTLKMHSHIIYLFIFTISLNIIILNKKKLFFY